MASASGNLSSQVAHQATTKLKRTESPGKAPSASIVVASSSPSSRRIQNHNKSSRRIASSAVGPLVARRHLLGLLGSVSPFAPFVKPAHSAAAARGNNLKFSPRAMAASNEASQGEDLLVVGAGVLGTLVAQEWKKRFPQSQVFGQTRTETRHSELRDLGIHPVVGPPLAPGDAASEKLLFPYVIFCAPPSGNDDYAGAIKAATESWSQAGSFLFTSSSALFDVNDNGPCSDADCPSVPLGRSPRTDLLLTAEANAFAAGGNAVRLAGLYTKERGAHTFWLRKGTVDTRPDHILNLIHYEDAASLCVAILLAKTKGQLFMGCDNSPVSREEVMDITVRSGQFEGSFSGFTGDSGPLGKKMDNSRTREQVGWSPKYQSFAEFLGVSARI